MPPKQDQGPPSWAESLNAASQAIASGLSAPDADVKFGLAIIGALATHSQRKNQGQPGGAGAGTPGGPPGAGGAGSPDTGGPPPGVAGPAGGGAPNQAMPSMGGPGAPTGPVPGGMSPGLSPNPDEMRRVLADVAGK